MCCWHHVPSTGQKIDPLAASAASFAALQYTAVLDHAVGCLGLPDDDRGAVLLEIARIVANEPVLGTGELDC